MARQRKSVCQALAQLLASHTPPPSDSVQDALVARHAAACPICASEERAMLRLLAGYGQLEPAALPEDMEQRLIDCLCNKGGSQ